MSASGISRSSISGALSHLLNLSAACAVLFTATHLIPRFLVVYSDMLGGQPLPPLTQFVLHFRWLWFALGIALALLVIYTAWRHQLRPARPLFTVGVILFAGTQVGFVIFTLFLPLVGTFIRVR